MKYEPPYIFRTYNHHAEIQKGGSQNVVERNPGYAHRLPIWQVARATSAAPTYFEPIMIEDREFIDGGFGTNNPAEEIYHEVCQMNMNNKSSIGLLISIGTGQSEVSRFGKGRLRKYHAILLATKQIAVDSEKVHEQMRRKFPINDGKTKYYRFNVPISSNDSHEVRFSNVRRQAAEDLTDGRRQKSKPLGEMAMDEWKSKSTLRDIKIATEAYLADPETRDDLWKVANILVRTRRERCNNEYWEIVSTGVQYRCVHSNCHSLKSQKMREREMSLRSHLRHKHGIANDGMDDYITRGKCTF